MAKKELTIMGVKMLRIFVDASFERVSFFQSK